MPGLSRPFCTTCSAWPVPHSVSRPTCPARHVPHGLSHTACPTRFVPHGRFRTMCPARHVPHGLSRPFCTACSARPVLHSLFLYGAGRRKRRPAEAEPAECSGCGRLEAAENGFAEDGAEDGGSLRRRCGNAVLSGAAIRSLFRHAVRCGDGNKNAAGGGWRRMEGCRQPPVRRGAAFRSVWRRCLCGPSVRRGYPLR